MPRDRSLDEFLGGGSDGDGDDSDPATETDPGDVADGGPDAGRTVEVDPDVEPKATTYGWSPDGGECAACGETVDARWRDDGALVCVNCKDW